MTKKAADHVYKKSGLTPNDIDVVELHDCFSANELLTYEALGLCEEGKILLIKMIQWKLQPEYVLKKYKKKCI